MLPQLDATDGIGCSTLPLLSIERRKRQIRIIKTGKTVAEKNDSRIKKDNKFSIFRAMI
jgi:hypothetical protein